ncbi:metallophosphoesterase [Botryobacter ruber]|uniref:metallophosphoesterase n=1 Tax=Botryobacter ruber TaxID=2171629 RepID=UPI000E0A0B27|nr:metallophosphoesterase [Botryobacter ruber]
MFNYFLATVPPLMLSYLLFSYWQERKYRKKPFYKLADIGWKKNCPPADAALLHTVAMIGDPGDVRTDGTDPVLKQVEQWKANAGAHSTALFLGDIIYPVGLPPEGHLHHTAAVQKLNTLLQTFQDFQGRCIFLSGNHDWNKGRKNGFEQMLRQENYVVNYTQNEESYLPRHGCPGPVTLQLEEGLLLLIINTQWWVHRGEKPMGRKNGCDYDDIEEFFIRLNVILKQNKHQRILVAAHHPLYSNALHGGKFTIKQHIFPLTAAHKRFLIPLPIIGSLYPFFRKFFGAYEDMAHPRYKHLRKRLLRILNRYSNIIYVAGHDHNLQHFEIQHNHYIVSGSGSKHSFVKKGGKATFTLEQLGFFVFNYYDNGQVWMEVHAVAAGAAVAAEGVVFRKELKSVLQEQTDKVKV